MRWFSSFISVSGGCIINTVLATLTFLMNAAVAAQEPVTFQISAASTAALGTPFIAVVQTRVAVDRALTDYRLDTYRLEQQRDDLRDQAAANEHQGKRDEQVLKDWLAVDALLRDTMRIYEPVVSEWIEATEETPSNRVPTPASNSIVAPKLKPER